MKYAWRAACGLVLMFAGVRRWLMMRRACFSSTVPSVTAPTASV